MKSGVAVLKKGKKSVGQRTRLKNVLKVLKQKRVLLPESPVRKRAKVQQLLSGARSEKKEGKGIVCSFIRGAEKETPLQVIHLLKSGLPVQELNELQSRLELPMEKLTAMLGISKATLYRRKSGGRLGVAESDRVVRFARLLGKAVFVMESFENGRRWLMSPQVGLGGGIPLEFAETEVGAREVENLLGRMEYGVYS